MAPPSYTHRQLLAGIRILGSTRVLPALIEETKLLTENGSGDIALDIAATMICAPISESFAVDQNAYHPVDPSKEPFPRCPILTLRDVLAQQHETVPKLAEKDPLRAQVIVRLTRRVNALTSPPSDVQNLDIGNIIQNMQLGTETDGQGQMDLQPAEPGVTGNAVPEEDPENIKRMLDNAAAAAAAGLDNGVEQNMDINMDMNMNMDLDSSGAGLDTSIDDVLNAADMAVGNPEFLDLDMEGMF